MHFFADRCAQELSNLDIDESVDAVEEVESVAQRKANVHFGIEGLEAATDDDEEEYSAVISEGSIAEVASKSGSRGGGNDDDDEYEEQYSSEFEKSLDISRDSAAAAGSKSKVREAAWGHASLYMHEW